MKAQFGTFDESSYEGNPLLCGAPLQNYYCSEEESPSQPMPNDEQEDDGFIDMNVFYVSFGVCYIIVVLAIAEALYINPLWRRRTGTKTNLSSPMSSKPVELCYANKKAFPFCDPIFYDPFGVVKALRIHVLLME
ncbi:hypothetical protein POTOM_020361 [Populus tomentosa]|uniref:Uncharacterized protein n=1 Tax=Populus tomentosa TaxID=118781 RepID=A0A8X8D0G3_POPTO|nr:hypothetical protein POTOM_020361 [Populus tomentosa]